MLTVRITIFVWIRCLRRPQKTIGRRPCFTSFRWGCRWLSRYQKLVAFRPRKSRPPWYRNIQLLCTMNDAIWIRCSCDFDAFSCDFVVVSRAILMHSSAWQMCPIFEGPSILGQKAKKCQGAFKCAICPISKTLFIFCTNGFEFRNIFSTLL